MLTAAVISFKPLHNDPRINRQVQWLQPSFEVLTAGPADTAIPAVPCVDIGLSQRSRPELLWRGLLLASRNYESYYWQTPHVKIALAKLRQLKPQLLIANELECLPLALKLRELCGARVVFDAHEFYPGLYENERQWRYLIQPYMIAFCRRYLKQADAALCVSQTMADWYKRDFGLKQAFIVPNAPAYRSGVPGPVIPERIRLIHHGLVIPDRHPEELIEMMRWLDPRFELNLMLMANNPAYLAQLKEKAHNTSEHIRFVSPVPTYKIAEEISQYDLGIHLLPPVNRNNICALPNKFFEFIQARLGIVASPNYEMERVIRDYDLGGIAEDYTGRGLAKVLSGLSAEDIRRYKQNSIQASQVFSAERSGKTFLAAVAQALA